MGAKDVQAFGRGTKEFGPEEESTELKPVVLSFLRYRASGCLYGKPLKLTGYFTKIPSKLGNLTMLADVEASGISLPNKPFRKVLGRLGA